LGKKSRLWFRNKKEWRNGNALGGVEKTIKERGGGKHQKPESTRFRIGRASSRLQTQTGRKGGSDQGKGSVLGTKDGKKIGVQNPQAPRQMGGEESAAGGSF